MKKGLVSFIIAAYNEEKFIIECVESCLKQTYTNVEVIITDDGSKDKTYDLLLNKYRACENVKIFKFDANMGKVAAFNNSYQYSTGEFIAIIGADDVNYPNRIEEQIKYLDKYDFTFCGLDKVNEDNSKIIIANWLGDRSNVNKEIDFEEMMLEPRIAASFLFKRVTADKIFPIPVDLPHEDWWIPLIASFDKNILFINKALYKYRMHENNTSGHGKLKFNDISRLHKRETRDIVYYQHVDKFIHSHKLVKYYDFVNVKLFMLEMIMKRLIFGLPTDKKGLNDILNSIDISSQSRSLLSAKIWERSLVNYLRKCISLELWKESSQLLKKLSSNKNYEWVELKTCRLLHITNPNNLNKGILPRIVKKWLSLKIK